MDQYFFNITSLPIPQQVRGLLMTVGILDIIDIIIVAVILYNCYKLLEDTSAVTLVKGIFALLMLTVICGVLELHVINWLLQKAVAVLMVALPVIFQPELRRALARIGQGRFFGSSTVFSEDESEVCIREICDAVESMSKSHTGALIICERGTRLNDIIDERNGTKLDAIISADLLEQIFYINTPLHDGAMIIRGSRIMVAGAKLPNSSNANIPHELGTRHRAAIGISEQVDVLSIIVSEETGIVSVAERGHIVRHVTRLGLQEKLKTVFPTEKREKVNLKELYIAAKSRIKGDGK